MLDLQLQTEEQLSKNQLSTALSVDILSRFPAEVYIQLRETIFTWAHSTNKGTKDKQQRILAITRDMDNTVYSLIEILARDKEQQIQKASTQLGHKLRLPDPQAVKAGTELLCLTEGITHSIEIDEEGTFVVSYLRILKETRKRIKLMQFLPPMVLPPLPWTSNKDGGYYTEHKPLLMGANNYHNYYQAKDAVNILQSMPWEIDHHVLDNERNQNKVQRTHGRRQYRTTVSKYKDIPFYFVCRYDKRGRIYYHGYDLNPQGQEYHKAVLSLHNKELCTDIDALKIAIANHAGYDKLTWDNRIKWFDNESSGYFKPKEFDERRSHLGPNERVQSNLEDWPEPILGRKALRAYYDTLDGKPTGYLMSLDATSSGIQIMSILTGCRKSALTCNLINTGKREDVYQLVVERMNEQLDPTKPVTRKRIKKPLMTHYYNSEAVPEKRLNEEQLETFYNVLEGLLPGCEELMEIINDFWDYEATHHTWTLPDGHVAHVKVREPVDTEIKIREFDIRFKYRYYKQQPSDNYRSLVANIVHSVDGYVCREMVRKCHERGIQLATIHDCFQFPPSYWKTVCRLYREILAKISRSNLLADILSEISGKEITINKYDDLHDDILNSKYTLS